MEKMMKKPEVEAVRFEDADVIATSRQVAKFSEAEQAHKAGKLSDLPGTSGTDKWVIFDYNSATGSGSNVISTNAESLADTEYNSTPYAWYDNGWQTDGKTWQEHWNNSDWHEG